MWCAGCANSGCEMVRSSSINGDMWAGLLALKVSEPTRMSIQLLICGEGDIIMCPFAFKVSEPMRMSPSWPISGLWCSTNRWLCACVALCFIILCPICKKKTRLGQTPPSPLAESLIPNLEEGYNLDASLSHLPLSILFIFRKFRWGFLFLLSLLLLSLLLLLLSQA